MQKYGIVTDLMTAYSKREITNNCIKFIFPVDIERLLENTGDRSKTALSRNADGEFIILFF